MTTRIIDGIDYGALAGLIGHHRMVLDGDQLSPSETTLLRRYGLKLRRTHPNHVRRQA